MITIETSIGTRQIDAEVYGCFAVHHDWLLLKEEDRSYREEGELYTVTHIPTGKAVLCSLFYPQAVNVAEALQSLAIDWEDLQAPGLPQYRDRIVACIDSALKKTAKEMFWTVIDHDTGRPLKV